MQKLIMDTYLLEQLQGNRNLTMKVWYNLKNLHCLDQFL